MIDLRAATSRDVRLFGRQLRKALWRDEPLALLPDNTSWFEGGCVLLADALRVLFADQGAQLVAVHCGWYPHAEHFLIRVGPLYLDGDGVQREPKVLARWTAELARFSALPRLVPGEPTACAVGDIPRDPATSRRIADHLGAVLRPSTAAPLEPAHSG